MSKKLVIPNPVVDRESVDRQSKAEKEYDAEWEAVLKDLADVKEPKEVKT